MMPIPLPTPNARRQRVVFFSEKQLLWLLNNGPASSDQPRISWVTFDFPPGTIVRQFFFDNLRNSPAFIIEHESFDEIELGLELPIHPPPAAARVFETEDFVRAWAEREQWELVRPIGWKPPEPVEKPSGGFVPADAKWPKGGLSCR